VPAVAGPLAGAGFDLVTPDGILRLGSASRALGRHLALMPSFPAPSGARARAALAPLLEHGIVAPQELPLRIVPEDTGSLDGWRFR
jgi:hypothetical protein